jgi:hypothetical protein
MHELPALKFIGKTALIKRGSKQVKDFFGFSQAG